METYKLVLPEHLNPYGYLFGGNLLKWVDGHDAKTPLPPPVGSEEEG